MFVSVNGKAKEVSEIYAGGKDGKAHKVTELFGSVNGIAKQLFNVKELTGLTSWAEIQAAVQDGSIASKLPLGTKFKIDLGTDHFDGETEWFVVDYTYGGQNTLVLMPTQSLIKVRYQTQTDKLRSYTSSLVHNECMQVINHLPEEIRNILVYRNCYYMNDATRIYSGEFQCIAPTVEETKGTYTWSYNSLNSSQLAFFKNNNRVTDMYWTRTRSSNNAYQMVLAAGSYEGGSTGITTNTTNIYGVAPLLFIG